MKMERKNNEIRLPAIQLKGRDNSKALSSTMPEQANRLRASLNKVDNLEKNLFSKLDAYDAIVRKSKSKRGSQKEKSAHNPTATSAELQGYETLQRLKPGLYNRFLEAKKCAATLNMTPSTIETPVSYKSQASLSSKEERSSSESYRREEKQVSVFVTAKEPKEEEEIKMDISEEEMNEMFQDYIKKEKLDLGTTEKTAQELQDLSQSLAVCEKEIAELTKSMQGLIRQIQLQCMIGTQEVQ